MKLVRILLLGVVLGAIILFTGCPEAEQMMGPVITDEPRDDPEPPTTVGEVKEPEEPEDPVEPVVTEPEEPTPTDTTPPTVVEVGWYSDWQLTEAVTDDIRPGDTIYTKVVFSEAMQHTVTDDSAARPALSIVLDDTTTHYQMLEHGVSLQSGEAKPLHGGTDNFVCKYTIPADVNGTIALRVGAKTADTVGNTVTEVSEHIAPFVVTEPESTITLPPGYELPAELTPTEPTVLSADEQALANAALVVGIDHTSPPQYFTTDHVADVISVLPHKDREEVYDLFVASVDLPFFIEAAEEMKKININLIILSAEAYQSDNWTPYNTYLSEIEKKQGLYVGGVDPEELRDIYFEENKGIPYQAGVSRYWFILEWYRIQLANPGLSVHKTLQRYDLLDIYRQSCRDGNIFGYDNPWS